MIIIFAHAVRPYPLFKTQKTKQVSNETFATGETVGLAEWFIDDTCLVFFILSRRTTQILIFIFTYWLEIDLFKMDDFSECSSGIFDVPYEDDPSTTYLVDRSYGKCDIQQGYSHPVCEQAASVFWHLKKWKTICHTPDTGRNHPQAEWLQHNGHHLQEELTDMKSRATSVTNYSTS